MNVTRPAWFFRVPQKKHLEWDNEKRFAVLTLRDAGTKPELIARAFGTRKTVIYNQVRLTRCSMNRVCFQCRRPLKKAIPGKPQLCKHCIAINSLYKRTLREAAMGDNKCIACRKNAPIKGHRYCRSCISATYRRRIIEKKCGTCGKHPLAQNSASQCKKCLKKNREYVQSIRG